MEQAYTKTVEDVADYFSVDLETGLTDDQIKKNRDKYGPNGKFLSIFIYHILNFNMCFGRIKMELFVRKKMSCHFPSWQKSNLFE